MDYLWEFYVAFWFYKKKKKRQFCCYKIEANDLNFSLKS